MGISSHRARIIGLLVLGTVVGGAAQAAERMHMPFDCRFDGARVHLRPSDERAYAVVGRHQREIFTACSPDDPHRCRSWFVYRFDFDCDGARVAWLDAAAAATRFADWDAWAEDGRFAMRMSPDWGVARERPLFARRRFLRRRYMARGLDDEAENPFGVPRIVTAPSGYAPAVGIPLTFSGADGRDAAQEPAAPPPPAVAAYVEEKPAVPAIPELPVRAPRQERSLAQPSPPTPPAAAPSPQPAPVATVAAAHDAMPPSPNESPTGRATAPGAAAAPAESSSQSASKTGSTTGSNPGGFTIINAPRPAAAAAAPPPPPAAPEQIDTGAVTTPAAGPLEPAIADAGTVSTEPHPAAQSELPPLPSADGPRLEAIPMATAAAMAVVLAGLAILGFWSWRRAPAQTPPAARDFGAISLEGGPQGTALALEPAAGATGLETPRAPNDSAEEGAVMDELPVPTTYAQALDILGASPDASVAAIKKIVDGLRQSWHPDLARSETDRAHRERRVRQINVAWDLVSQRRSAA